MILEIDDFIQKLIDHTIQNELKWGIDNSRTNYIAHRNEYRFDYPTNGNGALLISIPKFKSIKQESIYLSPDKRDILTATIKTNADTNFKETLDKIYNACFSED